MGLNEPVTEKQFAREIFFGGLTLCCLFAIFLFVAMQNMTGRNLSPLSYLFHSKEDVDEPRTIKVFKTEEDRRRAMAAIESNGLLKPMPTSEGTTPDATGRNPDQSIVVSPSIPKIKSFIPPRTSKNAFVGVQKRTEFPVPHSTEDPGKKNNGNYPVRQTNFLVPPSSADPISSDRKQTNRPKQSDGFSKLRNSVSPEQPESQFAPGNTGTSDSENPGQQDAEKKLAVNTSKIQNAPNPVGNRSISQKNPTQGVQRIRPRPDDSFWTISQRIYGEGKYFRELARYNRKITGSDSLGKIVYVPELSKLIKETAKQLSSKNKRTDTSSDRIGRFYTVRAEESLFEIAADQLGQGYQYVELIKLNREKLPPNPNAGTVPAVGTRLLVETAKE